MNCIQFVLVLLKMHKHRKYMKFLPIYSCPRYKNGYYGDKPAVTPIGRILGIEWRDSFSLALYDNAKYG